MIGRQTPLPGPIRVPIATNVEQISPYKNRVNGGNTYFIHSGTNTLKKAVQDPISTSWTVQDIILPADKESQAEKFDCYMTRFTVYDQNNTPLTAVPIKLSSAYRVPVYINNRYYVLDRNPITVETDTLGAVKVVQRVENLQGASLLAQNEDGTSTVMVSPTDNPVSKIAALDSSQALSEAQVTDDKGNPIQPLVDPATNNEDIDSAVASIQSLAAAYENYNTEPLGSSKKVSRSIDFSNFRFSPNTNIYTLAVQPSSFKMNIVDSVGDTLSDIGDAIVVAAGDLCNWLRDASEYVIQIIADTTQKVWNFVAKIGEKVYTFVINTIEKAIAALEAIFDALKTLIGSLIQFLKFLFSWDDISRTNDVFVNMIQLYLNYSVKQIASVKGTVNETIANLIEEINDWADITIPEGEFANQPMSYQQTQADYTSASTAPNTYLQDHFTNNIANARYLDDDSPDGNSVIETLEDIIMTLLEALKSEVKVLEASCKALYTQLFENDGYKTMSLADILKTVIAIISDTILASAAITIDALIDVVVEILEATISFFTKPIWIPVVSNILESVFGYEIKFSLLDIICLIGSVPATLIYKIFRKEAPFTEDDGFSTQIIEAKSIEDLQATLSGGGEASYKTSEVDYSKGFGGLFDISQSNRQIIFITSHYISATAALVKCPILFAEGLAEKPYVRGLSAGAKVCDVVQNLSYGIATMFAQPYPIQNGPISTLSSALTACTVLSKVMFAVGYASNRLNEPVKNAIGYVDGTVDLVLSTTSIAPIVYHFTELAEAPSNEFRTLAILGETAKLSNFLSDISRATTKFNPDPTTAAITLAVAVSLTGINSCLQYAEGFSALPVKMQISTG